MNMNALNNLHRHVVRWNRQTCDNFLNCMSIIRSHVTINHDAEIVQIVHRRLEIIGHVQEYDRQNALHFLGAIDENEVAADLAALEDEDEKQVAEPHASVADAVDAVADINESASEIADDLHDVLLQAMQQRLDVNRREIVSNFQISTCQRCQMTFEFFEEHFTQN